MNFNKELFEKSEAKEFGENEVLELGGHELVILDAREYTSQISGNTSLKVCVDIAGNDKQAGFFKKRYEENTNSDKKWPNGATKYVSLKDEQIGFLKGFVTSLERSNPNFHFSFTKGWEQLKGLKIAGQFGIEEYKKTDGEVASSTKLISFRSLDKLSEIKVPKVKTISGELVDYDEWKNRRTASVESQVPKSLFGDAVVVDDGDMPFEL